MIEDQHLLDNAIDTSALLEQFDDRMRDYETAAADVDAVGLESLAQVADARSTLLTILSKYEDQAVGTESFGTFLQCRAEVDTFVESLPDDLPGREAFEAIQSRFDKRRLHPEDFKWARERLQSLDDLLDRRERLNTARENLKSTTRDLRDRRETLSDLHDRLTTVSNYESVDFEADLEPVRSPIDRYNTAVETAFERYLAEEPAKSVVHFLEVADRYPLVSIEPLPDDVEAYLLETDDGLLPLPDLLEYSTYSPSKLTHYVTDPDRLKRAIATQQTAISRLDATPFRIDWPPPPADDLRWFIRELRPLVDRFAPDDVIAELRTIKDRSESPAYERLRAVAVARADLSDYEATLLATDAVTSQLTAIDDAIERIDAAIESAPE